MDANFLQMLAGLKPEDGSVNPYAAQQTAPPPAPPQQAPQNLLQGIAGLDPAAPPADPQAAAPSPPPQNAPATNALQALLGGNQADAAPPPAPGLVPARARSSLLDTIGRISDVVAKVGGADPLYQSTLDSRQDRTIALDDHSRQIALDKIKLALGGQQVASGQMDNSTQAGKQLGQAVRGLQAITKANPGADTSKIWPILAQQAGVDPAKAALIGQQIASDPTALEGLASTLNGDPKDKQKFGLQPFYATDAQGKTQAYQLGEDGSVHAVVLPAGQTAAPGQTRSVETGDGTVILDRNGNPVRKIVKAGGPEKGQAPIVDGQGNVVGYRDLPGARLPAPKGEGKGGKGNEGDPYTIYSGARSQIQRMDAALADLRGDQNLSGGTGYVAGALDTPARQAIQAKVAAIKGMAVPVATAILRAQGISRPAQQEVLSTANGIISDLGLLRQSSAGYIAGIDKARAGLASQVGQLDANARRLGVVDASGKPVSRPAPERAGGPGKLPPRISAQTPRNNRVSVTNW